MRKQASVLTSRPDGESTPRKGRHDEELFPPFFCFSPLSSSFSAWFSALKSSPFCFAISLSFLAHSATLNSSATSDIDIIIIIITKNQQTQPKRGRKQSLINTLLGSLMYCHAVWYGNNRLWAQRLDRVSASALFVSVQGEFDEKTYDEIQMF